MATAGVTVLAVAVVLPLAAGGCGSKEPGRFYGKGFSIKYPPAWQTQESFAGTEIIGYVPAESPMQDWRENVNVVIENLPTEMTSEAYDNAAHEMMEKYLTDLNVVGSAAATLDGRDAVRYEHSHRMGTRQLRVLGYSVVKGRRAYVITCTATPETYDATLPTFEDIVKTFRFE